MLFEILFIIFILVGLFLSVILFYSLKRINLLENFIIEFQQIIEYSSVKLKKIDDSGHFESDDEVGFVFEEIKQLQELLNGIFENKETEENSGAEEEKS